MHGFITLYFHSVYDPITEKHYGLESELAELIAEAMNLSLHIRPPLDGQRWGTFGNESVPGTGVLGELHHGIADIGWANLFISTNRVPFMDFSGEVIQQSLKRWLCFSKAFYSKLD